MRIYNVDIPDLFKLTAAVGFTGGLLYFISYHLIAKRFDRHLIRKLDLKYPDRWNTVSVEKQLYYIPSAIDYNIKISNW